MTIYIALLRGINVGGHNVIKMGELKKSLESMGLGRVTTYIQSGNVLFETNEEVTLLSQRIEKEIHEFFGLSVPVVLITAMELEQIIEKCPFPADTLLEGESLHVSFLAQEPSPEAVSNVLTFRSETEDCSIEGKVVYLFLRQSIRNSKLSKNLQKLNVLGTVRNWKTVNKLSTLAKSLEGNLMG